MAPQHHTRSHHPTSRPRRADRLGRRLAAAGVALTLVAGLTACGSDEDSSADDRDRSETNESRESTETTVEHTTTTAASPPVTTSAPPVSLPTAPASGIASYQDVQPAVVQIIADGTFRDPEQGQVSGAGAGSGFVISADGLVVTNNHVVTGAATLQVYVGGDTTHGYNARIVGVSECNDLALIDVDAPNPLPTLSWSTSPLQAGEPVYAAGFPLGDPEFTLTSGIVSKTESDGDMPWASLDSAIEHDAVIQPGNSGGPLVAADGSVVGVNYAFKQGITAPQYQAIGATLAQPVVAHLAEGDYESLGINGDAIASEDGTLTGIWVAGVAPGSPAADAGVLPGDVLTSLNGLPMGRDGTKADYCDVLRTSAEDAPLEAEVLRVDTGEVLRGEIRGSTPLEPVFSFAEEVTADDAAPTDAGTEIADYVSIVDDSGTLTVDVPATWTEVSTGAQDVGGVSLPAILAAPSIDAFQTTYDVPGLAFTQLPGTDDVAGALARFAPADCLDGGIVDYADPIFTGNYQVWTDCAGSGTVLIVVAAVPASHAYTALLMLQAVTDADLDALDRAFATFNVAS